MSEERTTERVLRLLGMLQQRPVWTAEELADRLAVTPRTVRRDVDRLRNLGYPVNASPGVGGGYQLGAGKALPPLLLDDEEAVATAVSLRLAAGGTVAGASEAAVRTLTKLDQVLPARLRSQVRALQDAIATLEDGRVTVDADALMALAKASRDHIRVAFDYVAKDGTATRRRIEPYHLVATGFRWYLLAYDLERDDWRTFRLDRLRAPEVGTWRFTPRDLPDDPAAYVQRAIRQAPQRWEAVVRLHAPLAEVEQHPVAQWVTLRALDDRTTELRTAADYLDLLALHIGRLGFDFTVDSPPELREEMRAIAGRMAAATVD